MHPIMVLASVLVLQPHMDHDGDLRLVASGLGDGSVEWVVDGESVATSADREPVAIEAAAGDHVVFARSEASGAWQALARPVEAAPGAVWVPGWVASTQGARPVETGLSADRAVALGAGGLGLLCLGWAFAPLSKKH